MNYKRTVIDFKLLKCSCCFVTQWSMTTGHIEYFYIMRAYSATQPGLFQFVVGMLVARQGRGNGIPSHWGVTHDPSEAEKNTDHCGGMYSSKLASMFC